MTGLTLIQQGSFTSDGASKRVDLPGGANYFSVLNQNEATATGTNSIDDAFKWEWWDNYAAGTSLVSYKTNGAHIVQVDADATNKLLFREVYPQPEAAIDGGIITKADGAAATTDGDHGYKIGDRVRFSNMTAMKQIAGMDFEITAIGSSTEFTMAYLDSSAFADAESDFQVRRIAPEYEVLPAARSITAISAAAAAVVEMGVGHDYVIGDVLYFRVPSDFGMVQMDGLRGKVTAVTAGTVTVDINSSAFTAFAFPASSSTPRKLALVGKTGHRGLYDDWFDSNRTLLQLDAFRSGLFIPYMYLEGGAGEPAGAASDVIVWQAFRSV